MTNTILITGSNRGIGLELCKQYANANWQVLACCRKPELATELQQLADNSTSVTLYQLDVSDAQQIKDLASQLKGTSIDVLLNNAGIYGQQDAYFGNIDEAQWLECLRINTISPLIMMQYFIEHVASSQLKTIASMSSKMASMADNGSGGSYVYRSSKAALNSAMLSAAIDLKPQGIKVAILHPGWVKTDMGGPNAEITTQQSADQLRKILSELDINTSGNFFDIDGSIIPW